MSTSMLTCPMCKKRLRGVERECPTCRTDISLLVDYVDNLRDGLTRAEELTRRGELGEAVWEYLSVLEVDPDNAQARKQVYDCVSCLNRSHMLFAWCSLFMVGFCDLYVRLCSMGVWTDWRIF